MIRRGFLGGALAGSVLVGGQGALGQNMPGEYLIRGAHLLTMDPTLGDMSAGDIHVRDGGIVAVGPSLQAPGAETIDGAGLVAMPGIVDTHGTCGTAAARPGGGTPQTGYFPISRNTARLHGGDTYAGTRLALGAEMPASRR
jgi:cytosine/adenosine deaminase-related metal-dependent hydrolase